MSDSDQIDRANRATAIAKAKRAAAEARAAEARATAAERLLDPAPAGPAPAAWERRDGETEKSFRAFRVYLSQEKRSLRKAAKEVKTTHARISSWSTAHEWVARAIAWDDHLAAVQDSSAESAARSSGETIGLALSAGLEVTRRAFESLLRDPARIEALDFADVVKALEQLGKLEQLVGGHATERVETSAPATSKEDRLSDLWSSAAGRALLAEARAAHTIGGRKGSA